ncbi:MAG TPA: nuclear transport factor 2 family protein [Deltaproteobacteria bacterium]|nr:nuclear transport factor 2 family protein [Deltaproteobacteria bacterium]
MTHKETIHRFFEDLERVDFDAVASHCASDCRYEDVPVGEAATAVGPSAIAAKLRGGLGDLEALVTTIHEIVEDGDTVLVERTEVWHHPTGERASLPVMAVFKFEDGKIKLWRDYWDMKTLFEQQPPGWLEKVAGAAADG